MGLGPTKTGAFTAMIPCLPMFFSTWETYHTHTLYLGYFNGPTGTPASLPQNEQRTLTIHTEGLILACTVMLISGSYGPAVWQTPLSSLFTLPPLLQSFSAHTPRDLWVPIILTSFFSAHLPSCILNVVKARRSQNLPLLPVFLEWIPMLVYTASTAAWLSSPYSILLQENRLVLFCMTQSFVFGRMTTKIILAHLTRQRFPYWTVLMAPLVGGAVLTNVPRLGLPRIMSSSVELWYLWAYFVFAVVVYFRWALLVINSICEYLGISCLTIPHRRGKGEVPNGKAH